MEKFTHYTLIINLRYESNLEAKILEKTIKKLDVNFFKIDWNHGNINSRIMERASSAEI